MRRNVYLILLTVPVLVLGILSGFCFAGTVLIPVSGDDAVTVIDPGTQWTDDYGITHIRGIRYTSVVTGQDADGVPITGTGIYESNFNIDLTTGNGHMSAWGTGDQIYGDLSGSWRATFTATIAGFVYDGRFNCPQGSGDFEGWHYRGTWTGIFGTYLNHFAGFYQIPGGGAKSITSEEMTWSSVKALYR